MPQPEPPQPTSTARRFRWRRLFQFRLRTLLILTALGPGYVSPARSADVTDETRVAILMRAMGASLNMCDQQFGHLPESVTKKDGKVLSSWRFKIMPSLQSWKREPFFDQAWDAPVNAWAADMNPMRIYCFEWGQQEGPLKGKMTNVLAIVGPSTAFEEGKPVSIAKLPSSLILLAEVKTSGLHWMQAGDLDVRTMRRDINHSSGQGISGTTKEGFHVCFADGEVWLLNFDTPFDVLEKFFTIESARTNNREAMLGKHRIGSALQFSNQKPPQKPAR